MLKLDISKTSGPDDVPALVLNMVALKLATPLSRLFQLCLEKELHASPLEMCKSQAHLSVMHNIKGDREACQQENVQKLWSTSSDLPSLVWFQGWTLYIRFDIRLSMSCQITPQQKRSTSRLPWHQKRVWHPGLLEKLSALGFSATLHAWLTDYLKGRSLKVVLNGRESGVKITMLGYLKAPN